MPTPEAQDRAARLYAALAARTKNLSVRDQMSLVSAGGDFDRLGRTMQDAFIAVVEEAFGDLLVTPPR